MADPDPIDNPNIQGQAAILVVENPDGEFVPVQGTASGAIMTSGGGGGGGGDLPAAAELNDATANPTVPSLGAFAQAWDPGSSVWARIQHSTDPNLVLGDKRGLHVWMLGGSVVSSPSETFANAADAVASGALPGAFIAGTVDQGVAHPTEEWGTKDTVVRSNSSAIRTAADSIDAKTPALVGGRQPVDGSGVVQPISAATLPLPAGAATLAAQTDGTQKAIARGGAKGVTVPADITSTAQGADHQAFDAQIYHGGVPIDPTQIRALSSGTDSIAVGSLPGSPAQEHVTAASPHAARLSDGAGFYDAAKAGDNMGADLRVAAAAVSNANPVPISDAGASITVDGAVTANVGTTNGLALDNTLTNGTQIAIAKGPVSPGAAVGSEKPVLIGGTDGTNAQLINVDPTGAVRLQSGGAPGATAPTRATQIGGSDGTNLRALKVDTAGRPDVTINSGSISVTNTPTVDTELPPPAALTDQTSNPTAPAVASFPSNWDPNGAQWNRNQGLPNGSQVVALDRSHLGPFGQIIAQPATFIAQVTFTYGVNTVLGTSAVSGTGATVDSNAGLLRLQCGTSNTGNASYLVNRPLLYRAGQGMGAIWSGAFTTGLANNTSIAGPSTNATNADGYFFGYKGTSFGIHHYRSGSEVSFTAQNAWNGTIPVGFDPTKLNLYDVRYPFLGAGDIFFFIADPFTGRPFLVHTIRYANSSTSLQISNPTLRFLARTVNTGNTTNLTMLVGSAAAYIVGARHFSGPAFVFNNQKAVTGGTETSVFSMRCATTLNGVTNRGAARVRLSTAVGDNGNTITAFLVRVGATLGGTPAFTPYNGSTGDNGVTLTSANSMLSFDTAATTSTGGTPTLNTGCARNSLATFDLSDLDIIVLPGETWTFAANPGANSNCAVFINGIEEW